MTNFERTVVGGLEFYFMEVWGNEFGREVWRQGLSILRQNASGSPWSWAIGAIEENV